MKAFVNEKRYVLISDVGDDVVTLRYVISGFT